MEGFRVLALEGVRQDDDLAERRREGDLLGSREVLALEDHDAVGAHRIQDLGRLLARECCGVDVVDDGAEALGASTQRAGAPAAAVEG